MFAARLGLSQRTTSFIASLNQGIHRMLLYFCDSLICLNGRRSQPTPPSLKEASTDQIHPRQEHTFVVSSWLWITSHSRLILELFVDDLCNSHVSHRHHGHWPIWQWGASNLPQPLCQHLIPNNFPLGLIPPVTPLLHPFSKNQKPPLSQGFKQYTDRILKAHKSNAPPLRKWVQGHLAPISGGSRGPGCPRFLRLLKSPSRPCPPSHHPASRQAPSSQACR